MEPQFIHCKGEVSKGDCSVPKYKNCIPAGSEDWDESIWDIPHGVFVQQMEPSRNPPVAELIPVAVTPTPAPTDPGKYLKNKITKYLCTRVTA